MTPERWNQVSRLFNSALEKPEGERAAFLDEACAGDEQLRRDVESLVFSFGRAEGDGPASAPAVEEVTPFATDGETQLAAGQALNHYQIIRPLGAGGMGEVYLAQDLKLGRQVALKLLPAEMASDPRRMRRFEQEAKTASSLNQPNILTVFEVGEAGPVRYIATEYVDGQTLREHVGGRRLKLSEVLDIAAQIAAALDAAHEAGIVHRDIKPENVMVRRRDRVVKVLDFGLAKASAKSAPSSHSGASTEAPTLFAHTEPGMVVGTVSYMSPEQSRGAEVDARTDVWSLGVVLYEMLTGRVPFEGGDMHRQIIAIQDQELPPVSVYVEDVPERLEEIVAKALTKERGDRYQTAKDFLIDLRSLRRRLDIDAEVHRSSPTERKGAAAGRTRSQAGAGGVAVAESADGRPFWKGKRFKLGAAAVGVLLVLLALGVGPVRRFLPGGAGAGLHSIVALPSKVYGPEEDRFLTDAIPNALSNRLAQVEGVETKAPPTSLDLERLGGDMGRVAEVFGVNAFVLSSVNAGADSFVLNVQLVEAGTRRLLWSQDFQGRRGNYLELVQSAAEGLRSALRPQSRPTGPGAGEARNAEAELVYQRGLYHTNAFVNRKQPADFEGASANLRRALELDPTMARAAAATGRLHVARIEAGSPLREVLPEIESWAYRALQLDHRSGEAWQILSIAEELRPDGDRRKRLEYALKAATYAGRSGYSHHVLSTSLARYSNLLALEAAREAVGQDPLRLNGQLFAASLLSHQGKVKEALSQADRVLAIEPDMPVAVLMKAFFLLRDRRLDEAQALQPRLDKMVAERRVSPGWVDFFRDWLGFEKSVERGDAKDVTGAALARLVKQARGQAPPFIRWETITQNVLVIQAQHDSVESALETLSLREAAGIVDPYDWLLLNPELKPVRRDARFQTIAARSRGEFAEMLTVLDDARQRGELPSYLEKPLAQARRLSASPPDQPR